jgi:hypothetical protein
MQAGSAYGKLPWHGCQNVYAALCPSLVRPYDVPDRRVMPPGASLRAGAFLVEARYGLPVTATPLSQTQNQTDYLLLAT